MKTHSSSTILIGTGDNRRKRIKLLKPIYVCLGRSEAAALPEFHCLTGCDTCGLIKGIGKKTAFKAFTKTTPAEHSAVSQLGVEEMPSADVVSGCEEFLCRLLGTKKDLQASTFEKLRWKRFNKSQPGE